MKKLSLPSVTLVIADCVDINRAEKSLYHNLASVNFADVKLFTSLANNNPYAVKIKPLTNIVEYSNFILFNMSKYVSTEHILITQWDGFIWHPELWEDEFLNYDYIGAPWYGSQLPFTWWNKNHDVGNGGFSIRSKKLMDTIRISKCVDQCTSADNSFGIPGEDVMIGREYRESLEELGFTFAPRDVASRFSMESGPYRKTFGVHARDRGILL